MQTKDGQTALHYAALYGKPNSAIILYDAGADMTLKNEEGQTALEHAVAYEEPGVAAVLEGHDELPVPDLDLPTEL